MQTESLARVSRATMEWPRITATVAALLGIVSIASANTYLLEERFTSTVITTSGARVLPDDWTITSVGGPLVNSNVGVVDRVDATFGDLLALEPAALLLEDRDNSSYPVVRAPWNAAIVQSPYQKGWMRIRFIPVEENPDPSPAYTTPRLFFRIRGSNDTNVVRFQVNGTRLYYYDESSGTSIGHRLSQPVLANELNELLVWFDLTTRSVRGELNGVTLTRYDGLPVSSLKTGLLLTGETLEDLEFRPGDGLSEQEAILLSRLEIGQGNGPVNRHSLEEGYLDVSKRRSGCLVVAGTPIV